MKPELDARLVDPRRFRDVRDDVTALVRAYLPEWRLDPDSTDPGAATVNVYAHLAELFLLRLNRVPRRSRHVFLSDLGAQLEPALCARAPLRFTCAPGVAQALLVPQGTEATAPGAQDPIPFETLEDLLVVPGGIAAVVGVDPRRDVICRPPKGFLAGGGARDAVRYALQAAAGSGSARITLEHVTGLAEGQHLRVELDGRSQLLRVAGIKDTALELHAPLAFDLPLGHVVERVTTFAAFDGIDEQEHVCYVGDDALLKLEQPALIALRAERSGSLGTRAVEWQAWCKDEQGKQRWVALDVLAGTIDVLAEVRLGTRLALEKLKIDNTESFWIRCRLADKLGGAPPPAASELPLLRNVELQISSGDEAQPWLEPDLVFANATQIDPNAPGGALPFGEVPRVFDALYVASAEAFSKVDARVTVRVETSVQRFAPATVVVGEDVLVYCIDAKGGLVEALMHDGALLTPEAVPDAPVPDPKLSITAFRWVDDANVQRVCVIVWGRRPQSNDLLWFGSRPVAGNLWSWRSLPSPVTKLADVRGIAACPAGAQLTLWLATREPRLLRMHAASFAQVGNAFVASVLPATAALSAPATASDGTCFVIADGVLQRVSAAAATAFASSALDVEFRPCVLEPRVHNLGAQTVTPSAFLRVAAVDATGSLQVLDVASSTWTAAGRPAGEDQLDPDPAALLEMRLEARAGTSLTEQVQESVGRQRIFVRGRSGVLYEWSADVDRLGASTDRGWERHAALPPLLSALSIAELLELVGGRLRGRRAVGAAIGMQGRVITVELGMHLDRELPLGQGRAIQIEGLDAGSIQAGSKLFFETAVQPVSLLGSTLFAWTAWEDLSTPAKAARLIGQRLHPDESAAPGTVADYTAGAFTAGTMDLDASDDKTEAGRVVVLTSGTHAHVAAFVTIPPPPPTATLERNWPARTTALPQPGTDPAVTYQVFSAGPDMSVLASPGRIVELPTKLAQLATSDGRLDVADAMLGNTSTNFVIKQVDREAKTIVLDADWTAPTKLDGKLVRLSVSGTGSFSSTTTGTAPDPIRLAWEYWNGDGWVALGRGSDCPLDDRTDALMGNGTVTFCIPPKLQPTEVVGQKNHWIRVRFVGGTYVSETFSTSSEKIDGKRIQHVNSERTGPGAPRLMKLEIRYQLPFAQPRHVLTHNNLQWRNQSDAARIGNGGFPPFEPPEVRGRTLFIGMERGFRDSLNVFADVEEWDRTRTPFAWSALTRGDWIAMPAEDDAGDLTRSGVVRFAPPAVVEREARFGTAAAWIRGEEQPEAAQESPRVVLVALHPNTVWAEQTRSVHDEVLGSSSGEPAQEFVLRSRPVQGALEIAVQEIVGKTESDELGQDRVRMLVDARGLPNTWILWQQVEDLSTSAADARHYELDAALGTVRFGDGIHGRIPAEGARNIRALTYRFGGGEAGNVGAAAIATLSNAIAGIAEVQNPLPAGGGADTSTSEVSARLFSERIEHAQRAVSCGDFERLAAVDALVARARCLVDDQAAREQRAPSIRIAVLPRSDERLPRPGLAMREALAARLRRAAHGWLAAAQRIEVVAPRFVEVEVRVALRVAAVTEIARVDEHAQRELARFLHPVSGGRWATGWEFGRALQASDVLALLHAIDGVQDVAKLEFALADGSVVASVQVAAHELLASAARHAVEVTVLQAAEA